MERSRRLGLVVAGFIAAALLLGSTGAVAASAVRTCSASGLRAWGGPTQGAAGTLLSEFAFVNRGSGDCSLIGYPKLQLLNPAGKAISTTDDHEPLNGFPAATRSLVVLPPGKRAYFGVFYPDFTGSGQKKCPTSAELALTPPGSSHAVTLTGKTAAITPYAGSDVKLGCGLVRVTVVTAKAFQ